MLHLGKYIEDVEQESKHSLHFVFYSLSSGSCSCFAQSRQIDPELPSFPYQNSETGSHSGRLSHAAALNELDDVSCSGVKYSVLCIALYVLVFIEYNSCLPQPQLTHWNLALGDLWGV